MPRHDDRPRGRWVGRLAAGTGLSGGSATSFDTPDRQLPSVRYIRSRTRVIKGNRIRAEQTAAQESVPQAQWPLRRRASHVRR